MRATEQLQDEHQGIKVGLKILMKFSEKLDSGEEVSARHLEQILDFIKNFADRCHHAKEEKILLAERELWGGPRDGGPIGVMLAEHDLGRGYVKEMSESLARYSKGQKDAARELAKNARDYINLLTEHIEKEDNILYPIADMHLDENQQKKLLKEFERIEREEIGEGKHEEYHCLLHALRDIYLTEKHCLNSAGVP